MKVEELMIGEVICCDIDDSVVDAANIMKEENIGMIGVMDGKNLVGLITDRDITIKMVAERAIDLEQYITTKIVSIDKDESIEKALELMGEKQIKRLIVNDKKKPIGVISISNIINSKKYDRLVMEALRKIYS